MNTHLIPKVFNYILINNTIASISTMLVWFSLSFYVYLETQSVVATSVLGGLWPVGSILSSMAFGTYIDHHHKKSAMMLSSALTLLFLVAAGLVYFFANGAGFLDVHNPLLWLFCILCLFSSIAGNMRGIAMPTMVTILVPEHHHDKANGLVGMTTGIVFSITSILSGLSIGFLGMGWTLLISIIATTGAIIHLYYVQVIEEMIVHTEQKKKVDFKGAFEAINSVPGLKGLLIFSVINNFIAGVFMALMDPYGLSLVSVEIWGVLWSVIGLGFIIGGTIVSKYGTGKNSVATIFKVDILLWFITIFFTIKHSIWLMSIGMIFYTILMPIIEAAEQTTIQKVVPLRKQGRVFGFNQTMEQAATPITAFFIGPIAQYWAIPFMSEGGLGALAIGSWFGVGQPRGLALIFTLAGILGFIVTVIAYYSRFTKRLSQAYLA